jgi:hypothetical protein
LSNLPAYPVGQQRGNSVQTGKHLVVSATTNFVKPARKTGGYELLVRDF